MADCPGNSTYKLLLTAQSSGLEEAQWRGDEGYVIDGGCEFGSIGALAFLSFGTWIQSQTNGEEEVLIHSPRNNCRNRGVAKLLSFWPNLVANEVSFRAGSVGFKM
jgi:hypothetical protein